MNKQSCKTCKFWVLGDQCPIENTIGNTGNCVQLLLRGEGFYDQPTHIPYWAGRLVSQTDDYAGTYCPVWKEQGK